MILAAGIAALPLNSLISALGRAQERAPSGEAALAKAVGVLTHEKSAAEQYAVILATAGRSNIALYFSSTRMPRPSSTR
jgi:hypothetical protein